jgi:hypothetical protein
MAIWDSGFFLLFFHSTFFSLVFLIGEIKLEGLILSFGMKCSFPVMEVLNS